MKTSERLFKHIEKLQQESDSSFEQYPANSDLMPNDAIYLVRVTNILAVLGMIETLVEKSGKDLKTVIQNSIKPSLSDIQGVYPHTQSALEVVIRDFG